MTKDDVAFNYMRGKRLNTTTLHDVNAGYPSGSVNEEPVVGRPEPNVEPQENTAINQHVVDYNSSTESISIEQQRKELEEREKELQRREELLLKSQQRLSNDVESIKDYQSMHGVGVQHVVQTDRSSTSVNSQVVTQNHRAVDYIQQPVGMIRPNPNGQTMAPMDLTNDSTLPIDRGRLNNNPSVLSLINKCCNSNPGNIYLELVFDNYRMEINAFDTTDAVNRFRQQCTEDVLVRLTDSISICYTERLNMFSSKIKLELYNELTIKNYVNFSPNKVTVGEAIRLLFSRLGLGYLIS